MAIIHETYIDLLETQLRGLFLLIKDGQKPAEVDRRYCEGLVHAAQALQVMTAEELQTLMERVNQEVFGMSITERQAKYPTGRMPPGDVADVPTFQRRGLRIE
jgi:hypothetical protein